MLQAFDSYIRDTTVKLNRKVEDLEDVRVLMAALKEVSFTLQYPVPLDLTKFMLDSSSLPFSGPV